MTVNLCNDAACEACQVERMIRRALDIPNIPTQHDDPEPRTSHVVCVLVGLVAGLIIAALCVAAGK